MYPIPDERNTSPPTLHYTIRFNEYNLLLLNILHSFPDVRWKTRINNKLILTTYNCTCAAVAPGPVTLEFSPRRVIKGRNVTLRCNAQYLGRPQHPTRYSWFRDGHQIYHQNQVLTNGGVNSGTGINPGASGNSGGGNFNPEWFVDHVSLETRANFTCSAYNEGGVTYSEPVYIEVLGKKTGRIL